MSHSTMPPLHIGAAKTSPASTPRSFPGRAYTPFRVGHPMHVLSGVQVMGLFATEPRHHPRGAIARENFQTHDF
jgi:hypothetical protein